MADFAVGTMTYRRRIACALARTPCLQSCLESHDGCISGTADVVVLVLVLVLVAVKGRSSLFALYEDVH